MIAYLTKRPMLLSAVIGIIVCITSFYAERFLLFISIIFIILFFFLIIKRVKPTVCFSFFIVILICISLLSTYNTIDRTRTLAGQAVKGEFLVTQTPVDKGDFYTAQVEVYNCRKIQKGTKILILYNNYTLNMGDMVNAEITLKGLENSDYKAYSYSEGIYLSGNAGEIQILTSKNNAALALIRKVQCYITNTLFENLSRDEAATINAITIGDKSFLSADFSENIRKSGVSHVMVVSGMHLAIIMSAIFTLLEKFVYNKYFKALVALAVVVFMCAVCGFTMSIIRAGIMYILMIISLLAERENNTVNTLGAAVSLILISSPFAVFSVSLQLSVMSTFGILVLSGFWVKRFKEKYPVSHPLVDFIIISASTSIAAMLMTLPLVVYYFGFISTVSLITNVLISYPVTLALVFAFVGLAINFITPIAILAKPFFFLSGIFTKYINYIINRTASFAFSTINVGRGAIISSVIIIILLLALRLLYDKDKELTGNIKNKEVE